MQYFADSMFGQCKIWPNQRLANRCSAVPMSGQYSIGQINVWLIQCLAETVLDQVKIWPTQFR